ncbi:Zinc finger, GRF-type [Sesbania bispinosa]|nr:Zinc finger, GRF-type [Sesbania bispinosa]
MTHNKASLSSSSNSGSKTCACGDTLLLLTSSSSKNPGRKFFRCPNWKKENSCDYFQWLDDQLHIGLPSTTHCSHCSDRMMQTWKLIQGKLERNLEH